MAYRSSALACSASTIAGYSKLTSKARIIQNFAKGSCWWLVQVLAMPLVDDNRAFAQKLRAEGVVKVEHFVREAMPHGFYFFPGMFEQGDEAFAAIARFLKQAGAA